MKLKINLNIPILDIDQKPVSEFLRDGTGVVIRDQEGRPLEEVQYLHKLIANAMYVSKTQDPSKFNPMAIELRKTGILEADQSDLNKIREIIKSSNLTDCVTFPFYSECSKAEKEA